MAFSVSRDWRECAILCLLLIIFKWISVQDNSSGWGTEGSEGRWVRQACIGWSVILNYQVCRDKTSGGCYIPTHCPRLPANANRTDGRRMCGGRGGVLCGGRRDVQTCVRAGRRVSLQSSLVSPTTPPPPRAAATHGGLSGARARAGGRLGARRHSLVAGVRLQTKTTLLQYCEQFHALTK